MRTRRSLGLLMVLPLLGCSDDGAGSGAGDELTSATGRVATIEWDSFVYVSPDADTATIQRAIQLQVKSAIGALRQPEIAIQDRDALHNLDPAGWRRESLTIAGSTDRVQRVRYHYRDTALLRRPITTSPDAGAMVMRAQTLQIPLLFGDYVGRANTLRPVCSDDQSTAADSLWFHFTPQMASCRAAIAAEVNALNAANARTPAADGQVTRAEVNRSFVTVRADLRPQSAAAVKYPEYDRLWGFGSDRTMLVVYAFFGVDSDIRNSHDNSLVEFMRFLATVRGRFPGFRVTSTRPYASLLDYQVGAQGVTVDYTDVARWITDDAGYPAAVGSDMALREQLRQQVIDRFAERWIYWDLPVRVTRNGQTRDVTVQLRTYWGYEDGDPDRRQAARWRYLEGMFHGDVFLYQGHSHFGHGPLEPTGYNSSNFPPDRYQVMMVNSCVSFNYYDTDFLAMHPGGSQNLDIIVNGLPAYWTRMGEASGKAVIGLIDGDNKSWESILRSMVVTPSWAPRGYDPLRAVNGEEDNAFDPARGRLTVTPR